MKSTPADLVVDALSVARLVRLIQEDEMPIGPARDLALDMYGDRKASTLLTCAWCLSPYIAAAVVLARHRWPRTWSVTSRILAGSQVAGMVADHT